QVELGGRERLEVGVGAAAVPARGRRTELLAVVVVRLRVVGEAAQFGQVGVIGTGHRLRTGGAQHEVVCNGPRDVEAGQQLVVALGGGGVGVVCTTDCSRGRYWKSPGAHGPPPAFTPLAGQI